MTIKNFRWLTLVLLVGIFAGCDDESTVDGPLDSTSAGDSSQLDTITGDPDSRAPDSGDRDAGDTDADGQADSSDGSQPDVDLSNTDTAPDSGPTDTGQPLADLSPDQGSPDTAAPDMGMVETCAPLPISCGQVELSATEHEIQAIEPCAFALVAPTTDNDALIDDLVVRAGGALTITDVLGDLNRTGQTGVTQQTADRLVNHAWQGFRWNSGDMDVSYWYPQGISGSFDATDNGLWNGTKSLLVSWYHRTDDRPTKGARISLADIDDLTNVTYRHMLLVEPFDNNGQVDVGPAQYDYGSFNALHAGGIVWYGDYLYVADTQVGLRVFDLSRIVRVSHVDNTEAIGITNSRFDAHGYRYAIPQLARYELHSDSCNVRFSFAGLDRSTDPPRIVTGEYHSGDPDGRIVAWPLDPSTGLLAANGSGVVRAVDAYVSGQTRMQGGLTLDGNVYISSSSQTPSSFGRLYRTRPGMVSSISAWPYGCEDLTYDPGTTLVWTAAEHPGTRDVVAIPIRLP